MTGRHHFGREAGLTINEFIDPARRTAYSSGSSIGPSSEAVELCREHQYVSSCLLGHDIEAEPTMSSW